MTSIGADFMRGCTTLRKLDVSPLSKIIAFEEGFLLDCTALEEVNLEAITSWVGALVSAGSNSHPCQT